MKIRTDAEIYIFVWPRPGSARLVDCFRRQKNINGQKINNKQQKRIGTESHTQAMNEGKRIRQKIGI